MLDFTSTADAFKQEPTKKQVVSQEKFTSTTDAFNSAPTKASNSSFGFESQFIGTKQNKDFGESKYDTNTPVSMVKSGDYQALRGEKQDLSDKWINGITKAVGIAGTSIAENTAGVVYGIGSALINTDASKLYHNDFTETLSGFNDYLSKQLPNYHTKAEQDYNLLQKIGTANFWSDQALNGLGYMAGAIATGYGLNEFASISKLARSNKIIDEVRLASEGKKYLDEVSKGIKILDNVDFSKNAVLMSYGESAQEADGIYKDTKKQLTDDFINKYGSDKLDQEALNTIESVAKAAGNWGFVSNLAITGTTNALLFPKLLSEGYGANKIKLNNIELQGGKFVAEQVKPTSGLTKEFIKGVIEEGGQESSQLLIQKTLTDYYSRGFKDKKDQHDFVQSLTYGLEQTLGTEEGLENFFLGALMGGPANAIQGRGQTTNQNLRSQHIADLLNNPEVKKTINSFDNFVRATSYEQDKNEALKTGSKFDYLNAEFNQNKAIAKQFIDNGGKDLLIQQYKDMQSMPEDEFKKVAGYDENKPLPKSQLEIINNAIKLVESLDKTNNSIKELFPYSKENHQTQEKYKVLTDNLWHYSTSIDNINKRIIDVKNDIFKIAVDKSVNLTGDGTIESPFGVQDNPLVAQQVNQANQDLQIANIYKQKLIEAYNLLSNPKTQKETLDNIVNTAQKESDESQNKQESKQTNTENTVSEELNQKTDAGYSTIALDYLFTGGRDVIQSTDYLLQALVGGFTNAATEINNIRNKYADKLGNIKDDINSDIYNQMMLEIRDVINKNYNNSKAIEIFDKILKNATGFTNREGNQVSIELDKLNEQNESKINAKYDAELAALNNQEETEINNLQDFDKLDAVRSKYEKLREDLKNKQEDNTFVNLVNNATSHRELNKILDGLDKENKTTPELIDLISKKRDTLPKNNNENKKPIQGINENSDVVNIEDNRIDGLYGLDGKLAKTPYKTTAGKDNDKKVSEQRYFRFLENNNISEGSKLLVVTKNNLPELYNTLLDDETKKFEQDYKNKENKEYQGIYTVLVDKDNKFIYSSQDGKLLDKGDSKNLVYSTILSEKGVDDTSIENKEQVKKDLNKFRDSLLKENTSIYLSNLNKSNGILVREKNENGSRKFNNVLGHITIDINKKGLLQLPTISLDNKGKTELKNGQDATVGKLYAFNDENEAIDLIPRNLTSDESLLITSLLAQRLGIIKRMVENPSEELEKLIQFGVPKTGPKDYTLGIKDNLIFIGNRSFTKEQLSEDPNVHEYLDNFLKTKYINVNKNIDFQSEFKEPIFNKETNNIDFKIWDSYQEYLLSNENDRLPLFGTDVPAIGKPKFRNHYVKYEPTIIRNDVQISEVDKLLNETQEAVDNMLSASINIGVQPMVESKKSDKTEFKKSGLSRKINLDRLQQLKSINQGKLSQEEKEWFKTQFPGISIETIQGLIDNKSLGRFIDSGKVLLSSEAINNTLRHEAFHVVTQLYLTPKEIKDIYNEARQRGIKGNDLTIEETLAEDFANYKDTGKILNNRPLTKNIFQKLLDFIKKLLGLKTTEIRDIYNKLEVGGFKNANIIGVKQFNSLDRSLPNKSESFSKEVLDGVEHEFFDVLFENGFTPEKLFQVNNLSNKIFTIVKDTFIDGYDVLVKDNTNPELIENYKYILNNWDDVIKLTTDRLSSFGIKLITGENEKTGEIESNKELTEDPNLISEESVVEDENKDVRSGEAFKEANKTSTKDIMFKQTKLLIKTLPRIKSNGQPVFNSLGLPQLVDFNSTYNYLLKNLSGISKYSDMIDKIKELSSIKPEFNILLQRLGERNNSISYEQLKFQNQFRQDFDKNFSISYKTIIKGDGGIYAIDATRETTSGKIKDTWVNNLKNNISNITLENNGQFKISEDILNIKDNLEFLNKIGINFSNETLPYLKNNEEFSNAVVSIKKYIKDNKLNISDLYNDKSDVKGNIKTLLDLESKYTTNVNELSFISTEGKTVYSVSLNNNLSIVKNIINNSKNLTELFSELPHLNTVYTQNSLWLKTMFDSKGNKKENININLDLLDGVSTQDVDNKQSKKTTSLTDGDKIVQELNNLLLYGKTAYIRASDKATEHSLTLSNYGNNKILPVSTESLKENFNTNEIKNIFNGYFNDELNRIAKFELFNLGKNIDIYNKSGNKWSVFQGILSKDTKDLIENKIEELKKQDLTLDEKLNEINNLSNQLKNDIDNQTIEFLNKYSKEIKNTLNNFGIEESKKLGISKELNKYSFDQIVRSLTVNDLINTIEQVKLFTGDMSFYKDLYKRTSGLTGCLGYGTKIIMYDGSIKEVQDIIVGDKLMGPDGNPKNVLSLARGIEQMYIVNQKKGINYRVNESHIISLKQRPYYEKYISKKGIEKKYIINSKEEIKNICLKDLLKKGERFFKNNKGWKTNNVFDFKKEIPEITIEPYYFGLWLGDGSQNNPNRIINIDIEVIDYLNEYANRLGLKINTCGIQHSITCGKESNRWLKGNILLNEATKLKMQDEKTIFDQYLFGSKEVRLEVLAGLIDSDGTYSKSNNTFIVKQIRKDLSKQIALLARSLGYCVTEQISKAGIDKRGIKRKEVYIVSITGINLSHIPTKIKRKKATNFKSSRNLYITGISFEKDIIDNYYGFELDGDHLFLLEDFTVTHNTGRTASVDNEINSWLNTNYKRLDNKTSDGTINVSVFEDSTQKSNYFNEYVNILLENNIDKKLVEETLEAYTKMDEGDAQGWITLDEYREFFTRTGDWIIKDDLFNKARNGEELNSDELKQFLLMPIKAQYFGPQTINDLYVPTYHKFSLMPLIPSMIKGKNLEQLNKSMINNKVGYSLFKSGSKVGTIVNDKGKANNFYTEGNKGEINTKDWNLQNIDYRFLKIQLDIAPKVKEKVVFGTQFRKLLFSNLFNKGVSRFDGVESLFNEYNSIISNLIETEKDKLIKELGINPESYKQEDVTKLIELLKTEAKDRNLADNIVDALQTEELNGKIILKYNFDSMVNKAKIDSMIMSLVNSRLIKQTMPGDAMIQGASSGFEKLGNRVEGSNELKFYRKDKNGKTLPMEIKVPFSKSYLPLLNKYKSIDNINKAIKEGLISKEQLTMVGYRIPTQGLNSIDFMEIQEFLPQSSGNLIILPTEIVAKSGGDYDIDKMNVFRPSLETNGDKKLEKQNRIISIAKEILENSYNFESLITPNSTKLLTDIVDELKYLEFKDKNPESKETKDNYLSKLKKESKNIKYTEQLKLPYKLKQFKSLLSGKGGIGVGAIRNTGHMLFQVSNVTLNKKYKDKFGEEDYINIYFKHNKDENGKIILGEVKDVNNINNISEVISQSMNAHVDVAKDPFIEYLNITPDTYGTFAYLANIGVPVDTILYFFKQPIISEYLEKSKNNKSIFIKASKTNIKDFKIVDNIKEKYEDKLQSLLKLDSEKFNYYLKDLKNRYFGDEVNDELKSYLLKSNQNSIAFYTNQLQLLDNFISYQKQSETLSEALTLINHDTAGLPSNLESIDNRLETTKRVLESGFINGLEDILKNTFIGSFDQNQFTKNVYSQFYSTQNKEILENNRKLLNYINPFNLKDKNKIITLINNDLINYVIQNYGYKTNINDLIDNLFKGDNSIAKQLISIKTLKNPSIEEQKIKDNLLIKELYPLLKKEGNKDNIKMFTRRIDSFTSNQLTESFRELENLKPQLAKDLMDLGILQSGLNNSPITFMGIIPFEYYGELVKNAFIEFDKKNGASELNKFNELFIRNNSKDSNISFIFKDSDLTAIGNGMYGKNYDKNIIKDGLNISKNDIIEFKELEPDYNNYIPEVVENDRQAKEDYIDSLIDELNEDNEKDYTKDFDNTENINNLVQNLENLVEELLPKWIQNTDNKKLLAAEFTTQALLHPLETPLEDRIFAGKQAEEGLSNLNNKEYWNSNPTEQISNMLWVVISGRLAKDNISEKDMYNNLFNKKLDSKKIKGPVKVDSLSNFKKEVGLRKSEIAGENRAKILGKLKKFNIENNTNYSIQFKKLGESTLYTFTITGGPVVVQTELDFVEKPVQLTITHSEYSKMINDIEISNKSKEEKASLIKELNEAKTDEEIGSIIKKFCK